MHSKILRPQKYERIYLSLERFLERNLRRNF